MRKFRPVRFLVDLKAASVPVIWIIKTENGHKCYWPLYGLNKKIRNCAPPPLEVDTVQLREWKLLDCVLLSRKEYYTYEDADKAISLASEFDDGLSSVGESTRLNALSLESVGSATGITDKRSHSTADNDEIEALENYAAEMNLGACGTAVEVITDKRTHSTADKEEIEALKNDAAEMNLGACGTEVEVIEVRDIAIQVNLEDVDGEEKMIELLKIEEDEQVETLQESLKNGRNYCALIAVYTKMYAENPEDWMKQVFCRTFEYNIRIKIVFRPYENRIDVKGTPLLNCWIDSLRQKYGMDDNEAMSIVTSMSLKIRKAKAQSKFRSNKKQRST